MNKVTLSGHILVPESELAEIRKLLGTHTKLSQAEEGCLTFDVTEHSTEIGRFDVYEEFSSTPAFEFHQKRVHESEWGARTKNAQRFYTVQGLKNELG